MIVEGADAAIIFVAAATDFRGKEPKSECARYLSAARKPYWALSEAHVRDHQALFRRVTFDLKATAPIFQLMND